MKKFWVTGFAVISVLVLIVLSGCGGTPSTSSATTNPPPSTTSKSNQSAAPTTLTASSDIGPTKLVFTTQPGGAKAGQPFTTQPVVTIEDQNGNPLLDAVNVVTIILNSNTGTQGAQLSGTASEVAVKGVATFTDLSIDKAGTGYILQAVSRGPGSVNSAPFDVSP